MVNSTSGTGLFCISHLVGMKCAEVLLGGTDRSPSGVRGVSGFIRDDGKSVFWFRSKISVGDCFPRSSNPNDAAPLASPCSAYYLLLQGKTSRPTSTGACEAKKTQDGVDRMGRIWLGKAEANEINLAASCG